MNKCNHKLKIIEEYKIDEDRIEILTECVKCKTQFRGKLIEEEE